MHSRRGKSTLRLYVLLLCVVFTADSDSVSTSATAGFDTEAWVNRSVNALVASARAAFEDDDAIPAYHKVVASIERTLTRRRLASDSMFAARYRTFLEYVRALSVGMRSDHQLGFEVTDKDYFKSVQREVEVPAFLLEPRFVRAASRFETLERAKAYLRRINSTREPSDKLIFFSYTSRHLGTPDNDDSFRRLLIVVPGDNAARVPEKWVQFGVTDPGTRARTRNLSVVSATFNGDGTFNTCFKDYFRTYHRDGSISIKGRWELGYGDDNCARCHKSGILPIFPEKDSVPPGEEPMVEAVNRRLIQYGSPRFASYLDESEFGPGLGSANVDERNKRFGEGFSETVVGRAMNCAACHRPERLGYLNWPMDQVIISSYVNGGHMPLGSDLTESEREELYEKLVEEYFATDNVNPGILKSWLLGTKR
jgi:hypothetical protein